MKKLNTKKFEKFETLTIKNDQTVKGGGIGPVYEDCIVYDQFGNMYYC